MSRAPDVTQRAMRLCRKCGSSVSDDTVRHGSWKFVESCRGLATGGRGG